jgi:acetyltransferase-like isoleucine patch superfamily enzyme
MSSTAQTPRGVPGSDLLRFVGGVVVLLYEFLVYFLSLCGPILAIRYLWSWPMVALLALALIGYWIAGALFLSFLVLTRRVLIGQLSIGWTSFETANAKRWLLAAALSSILDRSPFRAMTTGSSLFASLYHRGMGANMPASCLVGDRAFIVDPWFLEIGERSAIGADAIITGHVAQPSGLFLGRVIIGHSALIGARTLIFPDVRIGNGACVAAGAVVLRGTVIPDGETWGGVPAKKIDSSREQPIVRTATA